MQSGEIIRVILFVGGVLFVYATAGLLLAETLLRRKNPGNLLSGPVFIWFRRTVYGLAAVGVLCIGYGFFIEPYWLEVTEVRLESRKLKGATRPIRIVHFSDLHSDPHPRLEERLPDVVAGEKPDLIVFTGDTVNSRGGIPVARRCLARLAAVAPTFVVKGNWDAVNWRGLDLFKDTGVRAVRPRERSRLVAEQLRFEQL